MKSSKGADFERRLAKRLSIWWTHGERDDVFWRSQQSGGRATQRRKKGIGTANQEGDIQAMDAIGQPLIDRVCIEAKCGYGGFGFERLLSGKQTKSIFSKFVTQCEREVEGSPRIWWLIVKQDFCAELIIFPISFILPQRRVIRNINRVVVHYNGGGYVAMRLDDFLNVIKPEEFGA